MGGEELARKTASRDLNRYGSSLPWIGWIPWMTLEGPLRSEYDNAMLFCYHFYHVGVAEVLQVYGIEYWSETRSEFE